MSRFFQAPKAEADLESLDTYLDSFSVRAANRLAKKVFNMLHLIAEQPYLGLKHSSYTRLCGQEVRSRLVYPYRIFYFPSETPEITAIIHRARQQGSIMAERILPISSKLMKHKKSPRH